MNISIFGLGYVGCVSMGCLSKEGHNLIGVDIDEIKVDLINNGLPTVKEKGLDVLIEKGVRNKIIKATKDYKKAVKNTDVSIVTVGTPKSMDGSLNLTYLINTCLQIGASLNQKKNNHYILIRSTIPPGTCSMLIEQIIEKTDNKNFSIIYNPEFLREGSAIDDYMNPPLTIIGSNFKQIPQLMNQLFSSVKGEKFYCDLNVSEIMKYVNNSFHALKIAFSNEIGSICKSLNIDGLKVMELVCQDTKLNISPYYMKPGFPYGGSCLPKDLSGLKSLSKNNNLNTPLINSINKSNDSYTKEIVNKVLKMNKSRIGIMGVAFKSGTDDLRNSPALEIGEYLFSNNKKLCIYDDFIDWNNLIGQNKVIFENSIVLKKCLIEKFEEFIKNTDLIILNTNIENSKNICKRYPNKTFVTFKKEIIDLNYRNIISIV